MYSRNNGTNPTYRRICFDYHIKECVICGEKNIISVHHFDGNHYNNDPINLIPMCPTHHSYMHSGFKYLIEEEVWIYYLTFISDWLLNNLGRAAEMVNCGGL